MSDEGEDRARVLDGLEGETAPRRAPLDLSFLRHHPQIEELLSLID